MRDLMDELDELMLLGSTIDDEFNIRPGRQQLESRLRHNTTNGPELAGGDIDAQWEMAESSGDETVGGSMMTPDQNLVDEFGDALGIGYGVDEMLRFGEKERERDVHRWELDPASAEDYDERMELPRGYAVKLLHWR
jgi:hypothetical protein